jgi:hypothetical protein
MADPARPSSPGQTTGQIDKKNKMRTCFHRLHRRWSSTCLQFPIHSRTPTNSRPPPIRPSRGGDAREAVKALIVANHYLETDLEKLKAAASMGYARGKLVEEAKTLPRDRKDWYD